MQPGTNPDDIQAILSRFHTWAERQPVQADGNGHKKPSVSDGIREISYEEALRQHRSRQGQRKSRATAGLRSDTAAPAGTEPEVPLDQRPGTETMPGIASTLSSPHHPGFPARIPDEPIFPQVDLLFAGETTRIEVTAPTSAVPTPIQAVAAGAETKPATRARKARTARAEKKPVQVKSAAPAAKEPVTEPEIPVFEEKAPVTAAKTPVMAAKTPAVAMQPPATAEKKLSAKTTKLAQPANAALAKLAAPKKTPRKPARPRVNLQPQFREVLAKSLLANKKIACVKTPPMARRKKTAAKKTSSASPVSRTAAKKGAIAKKAKRRTARIASSRDFPSLNRSGSPKPRRWRG